MRSNDLDNINVFGIFLQQASDDGVTLIVVVDSIDKVVRCRLEDVHVIHEFCKSRVFPHIDRDVFLDGSMRLNLKFENFDEMDRVLHQHELLFLNGNMPLEHSNLVRTAVRAADSSVNRSHPSFPRMWRLLGYVVPRKTRLRIYEPAYQDMLQDYTETRKLADTRASKRWIFVCFTFQTLLLVVDCFRAVGADKFVQIVLRMAPERVKRWWIS